MARTFRRYLRFTSVWAHAKILISFVMVAGTVDTQFRVVWPANFLKALDALSFVALGFGVLSSIFCLVEMDFYDPLLSSTHCAKIKEIPRGKYTSKNTRCKIHRKYTQPGNTPKNTPSGLGNTRGLFFFAGSAKSAERDAVVVVQFGCV
jgi:hypothetical protein